MFSKFSLQNTDLSAAAAPPPFRHGNPALCGSCPLVTPYCRLGDLLCIVFMSAYCMFDLSVYYLFLQYFDTVGWVFWPVKTVFYITMEITALHEYQAEAVQRLHFANNVVRIRMLGSIKSWR